MSPVNQEMLDTLTAIELALRTPGITAADVLDENSPIRDGIRTAIINANAALTAAQPAPKHEALARKLRANADDYRQRRQYPTDEHAAQLFSEAADALTAAQPALLTDADIDAIADSVRVDPVDSKRPTWHKRFARAVERRVRDANAQDAARYRWLRDNPWPPEIEVDTRLYRNARWDSDIDAAMRGEKS